MKAIVTFILLLQVPIWLSAGAWPQPRWGGYFKLDHTFILARDFYNPGGEIERIRTLGNYSTSFYGEFGFTKRLTGIAYVPFWVHNTLNETVGRQSGEILEPARTNDAFGDIDLSFKYGILVNTPVVLSTTLTLGLPTGDSRNVDGLLTGDGEFNQMLEVEAGAGLGKAWVSAGLGYNRRTQGFTDELRYDFEFGYKFFKERLFLIFKLSGVEGIVPGSGEAKGNALFSNDLEYTSPQLEAAWKLNKNWGISYRIGGAVRGQNVLAAPSHSFGVFYELR
jgi:protein XagA